MISGGRLIKDWITRSYLKKISCFSVNTLLLPRIYTSYFNHIETGHGHQQTFSKRGKFNKSKAIVMRQSKYVTMKRTPSMILLLNRLLTLANVLIWLNILKFKSNGSNNKPKEKQDRCLAAMFVMVKFSFQQSGKLVLKRMLKVLIFSNVNKRQDYCWWFRFVILHVWS